MGKSRKPKRSYVDALLERHKRNPSPKSRDPRQLDLMEAVRQAGFKKLDEAIERELEP